MAACLPLSHLEWNIFMFDQREINHPSYSMWKSTIQKFLCSPVVRTLHFDCWGLGFDPWSGNGTPLQYSCLENPMDGGAWWAAVHGVTKSRTRLSDFTFTFHFHALEKEMATHSSALAWRIPGTGEPGGLLSIGSHRVGHNWATSLSLFTFLHWRRKWQPSPVFLPGESQGQQSLVGCHLWGRTQSDTTEAT